MSDNRNAGERIGEGLVRIRAMTQNQVDHVLKIQDGGDKRLFGEIAIELGFLKEADVERVLELQRKGRPLIGEILVQMDLLDRPELERQLEAFLGSGTS